MKKCSHHTMNTAEYWAGAYQILRNVYAVAQRELEGKPEDQWDKGFRCGMKMICKIVDEKFEFVENNLNLYTHEENGHND